MKFASSFFSSHKGPCILTGGALVAALANLVYAQAPAPEPARLPDIVIQAEAEAETVRGPFLPPVQGAKIYEAKKTTVVTLEEQPPMPTDEHRRAFAKLPGLLVSEMAIPSHLNLNYRGIGDPHESEFVLTLKDGIPISSDLFGYPTAYYTPPLQTVDRIEFVRGGSALLYGPQPGPKLNFITARPPLDRAFTFSTEHVVGSYGLYSTFSQFGGTIDQFGYLGGFYHRQADGFRDNADYRIFNGDLKLTLLATEDTRWTFAFYGYESESGEAGRLTLEKYLADRRQTTRPIDRIWVSRYVPSLSVEHNLSPDTLLVVNGWAGYQDRFSRRQSGANTDLDRQEFFFTGVDTRLRHFWSAWDEQHTLTAGFTMYAADSPRSRKRNPGVTTALDGPVHFDLDRSTLYGAVFAENKFQFGRFSVVPAVRADLTRMEVEEKRNVGKDLQSETFSRAVPLVGLGLSYDLTPNNAVYANVSQGYRPPKYDDLVNPTRGPRGQGGAPDESHVWNFEIGVRGTPTQWLAYDSSLFFVDWDGFVETQVIGTDEIRSNSGRAQYFGWETAAEIDLIRLYDDFAGTDHANQWGSLSLFGNVSLLDAEFVSGRQKGNEPAYAPAYTIKAGAIYRWKERAKISLTGTFVDEHFWQDSNRRGAVGTETIPAVIPAYGVWDLAAEARVYRDRVSVLAGINNLFNEDYYARIRGDGIEVTPHRNYYAGLRFSF
jgi:Fe(3+) dicitrate transport protein